VAKSVARSPENALFVVFVVCLTFLLSACAASTPRLKAVTQLAPPGDVTYSLQNGIVKVSWKASRHEADNTFAGYNLYVADHSLIFSPVADLPQPYVVPKRATSYELRGLNSGEKVFLHLRSRATNGDLSYPSLPEIIISFAQH